MRNTVKKAGIASYWLRKCLEPYSSLVEGDDLVLDVGSGHSPYRVLWQHAQYLAIDLASRDTDVVGDICSLPAKSGSADLVVCTEVLEHVFDTNEALAELSRVLRPDGHLVLSTPLIMGRHEVYDYYRFTTACLERHFEACGLEIVETCTRGGIFSCLGLLLTHLPAQVLGRSQSNCADHRSAKRSSTPLTKLWWPFALALQIAIRPLVYLDRLDKKRRFTLGYVFLCSKKRC